MEFIILSYPEGMAGDFIASEISKNPDFVRNIVNNVSAENMYHVSNHMDVINFNPKNILDHEEWDITEQELKVLNNHYDKRRLVIPTHWFNSKLERTCLPCHGLRVDSQHQLLIRFSYCMAWVKTEIFKLEVWPARRKEILNLIKENHFFKDRLLELLEPNNYCNWKFQSYIFQQRTLVDNKPNLNNYIRHQFNSYKTRINSINEILKSSPDWYKFDISYAFLEDRINFSEIEERFQITLDKQSFKNYFQRNQQILHSKVNMKLDDLEQDSWIDVLYENSLKFFDD